MNTELRHYGVKGMRWGVRNDKSGGKSGKKSKYYDKDGNPNHKRIQKNN